MSTEPGLLHLLWLASPVLPVGGFSYSEGLEAAVEARVVHDETSAARWLLNQLTLVQARSELPVVARAHAAALAQDGAALKRLNDWVMQTRETAELLQQTQQMGRSLLAWWAGLVGGDSDAPADASDPARSLLVALRALQPAPAWPVVQGCVCVWRGLPVQASLQALAFGWAENLVQAAMRSVPLGQSAGQRLLAALVEAIPEAVESALAVDEAVAFAPGLAVLSARHETQYSRLFRS